MNTLIFIIYYNIFFTCMNSILTYINYEDKIKRLILTINILSFLINSYIPYISMLYFFNYISLEKCIIIQIPIFISYLLCDCINMIKYKNFNKYETWFHHIVSMMGTFSINIEKSINYLYPLIMFTEISTPFLCISDTFKNIQYLQKSYPNINKCSRIMFVITFLSTRILLMTYEMVPVILYTKISILIKILMVLFLMLQYYWGYSIYKIIIKLLK